MRTAKEIRQYLIQQRWYKDYVRNVKKNLYLTKKDKKEFLKGYQGDCTILYAFCWIETLQGSVYWSNVWDKFMKWYSKGKKKYENRRY